MDGDRSSTVCYLRQELIVQNPNTDIIAKPKDNYQPEYQKEQVQANV